MITAQSTTILNIKSYLSQHILASKKKHCQSTYDVGRKKRSSSIEKKLAIGRHPVMARHFVLSIKIWAGLAVQGWTQEFPVEYIVYTSIYTQTIHSSLYSSQQQRIQCRATVALCLCTVLRFSAASTRRCRDSLCHSTHTIGPRGIPHNATSDPNFGPQGPSGTLISIDQVGFFKVNIIKFHTNWVIQQFVRF